MRKLIILDMLQGSTKKQIIRFIFPGCRQKRKDIEEAGMNCSTGSKLKL